MILPVADRGPRPDARALELDVELALRLDGFRWVCWLEGRSPDPPRESTGRFLARRDDPLAHIQMPATLSAPLAPQPYRSVPRYSREAGLALALCDRIGLFRDDGVVLRHETGGGWVLQLQAVEEALRDASLALLLARAALATHTRAGSRKDLQ